jgi:hypothetical protein
MVLPTEIQGNAWCAAGVKMLLHEWFKETGQDNDFQEDVW